MNNSAKTKKLYLVEKLMGNIWKLTPKHDKDMLLFKHCTGGEHALMHSEMKNFEDIFKAHNLITTRVS